MKLCECGCGRQVRRDRNRFLNGHNKPRKKANGFPAGVLVDEVDRHLADRFRWFIAKSGGYVYARIKRDGKPTTFYLHRVITGCGDETVVDHVNHDTKDNRRANLRVVSQVENGHNRRGLSRSNRSGHANVYWDGRRSKWVAMIRVRYRNVYIGSFADPAAGAASVREYRERYGLAVANGDVEHVKAPARGQGKKARESVRKSAAQRA